MRSAVTPNPIPLLTCVLAWLLPCASHAQQLEEIPLSIQRAVLAENWHNVKTLCGSNQDIKMWPVRRAIKGHACLVLNENDEALALFLSLASKDDQKAWSEWTERWAKLNDGSAVSHYLRADALARMGLWKEAVTANADALRKAQGFALALNARGIARAALGEFDAAYTDLGNACKFAPSFADARANLGTVLYRKRAIKGAIEQFELADKMSPQFSLAKNGCACCYFLRGEEGDWEKAKKILQSLTMNREVGVFFLANLNSIANEELRLAKEIAAKGGPGSVFDVQRRVAQLDSHIAHNQRVLGITQFDPMGWTSGVRDEATRNLQNQIAERSRLMESVGQNPHGNPGGVKTKEIEEAFIRNLVGRKELPVETWFGLAQRVSL